MKISTDGKSETKALYLFAIFMIMLCILVCSGLTIAVDLLSRGVLN